MGVVRYEEKTREERRLGSVCQVPGRLEVPAGALIEMLPGPSRGGPRLVPAPGSIRGFDEERERVSVYRTASPGRIGGRAIPEGARVIVARRAPEDGELVVKASRNSLYLCAFDPEEAQGEEGEEGRTVGAVEGIISEAPRWSRRVAQRPARFRCP